MDLRESITHQNDVALTMTKQLFTTTSTNTNIVFCPISIQVVLSLIAAGSNGPALEQLLTFLKSQKCEHLNSFASELVSLVLSDGSAAGGPKLSFSNGVWIDKSLSFKESFKGVLDAVYKASSEQVDFQNMASEVTSQVNSWAEKETNGLIKEILPLDSINSMTRLIFANALYFKGAWNEKFDTSAMKDYDFHLLDGASVQAPFMTTKKKQYLSAFNGFKVLGLPYKQGEDKRSFSMYIFLPDAVDGISNLSEKIGSGSGFVDQHLPRQSVPVGDLRVPKFKISFGFEASDVLKQLGVTEPFVGGLTEMVDSSVGENLCVSKVFHKSFIEVNEEGTEAGAASAATMAFGSSMFLGEIIDFVADHPFLFLIREDVTGVVLFLGRVLNPVVE